MKRFVAFTAIMLLSAGLASAGPIVPKDIGAAAKWFGHVNFEAIRSMKLVQDLKDQCPVHQQCEAKMEELAKKLGMNPLEDVLGATLYANSYGGQVGVGIDLREETRPGEDGESAARKAPGSQDQ